MTTSEKLMDASQRLAKLSERAKLAEVHAAEARTQAKADVEKSADQARAAAEAHAKELRTTAAAAGAEISDSWDGIQKSWVSHVAEMRRNIDAKKSEIDAKRAESHAGEAEADAIMAIDYAVCDRRGSRVRGAGRDVGTDAGRRPSLDKLGRRSRVSVARPLSAQ